MPFSAGVFSKVYSWATEQLTPPIAVSKLDTQETDFATGLSNCILRDGTGIPTADTPWNSKKITGLGNASADADALNRVTADARYGRVIAKYKSADTNRSSTTTVTDDPDLVAALEANAVYVFDLFLRVSPNLGGLKVKMNYSGSVTAGPSYYAGHAYLNSAFVGGITTALSSNFIFGGASGSANDSYRVFGTVVTTSAANLSLQWAQGTSNGASSSVLSGSSMLITKVA